MHGSRLGTNKVSVYKTLILQDIGYRTDILLGNYVGGTVGFIGCEELGLIYFRYVSTKGVSKGFEVGS